MRLAGAGKIGFICLTVLLCLLLTQPVSADDSGTGTELLDTDQLDFEPVDDILGEDAQQVLQEQAGSSSFSQLLQDLLSGSADLSLHQWMQALLRTILGSVKDHMDLMLQLIALTLLSQLFAGLSVQFGEGSASSVGFLCVYGVMVMVLIQSFQIVYALTKDTVEMIRNLSLYMMPAMAAIAVAAGYGASGLAQSELATAGFSLILTLMKNGFAAGILWVTVMEAVNLISRKQMLSQLTGLIRTILEKGMKVCCSLYLLLMGIFSVVTPAADRLIYKTSSAVISSVPVVGGSLSGAMESVMAGSVLIKNGIGAAGCIVLLCICLTPVARLAAMWLCYRGLAAFLAPVADERVVQLLTALGRSTAMLLGLLFSGMVIFTGSVGVFILATGR